MEAIKMKGISVGIVSLPHISLSDLVRRMAAPNPSHFEIEFETKKK
ncbi:hypothetical protein COLO4_31638 [Corchorus olitorius]|uniref:Uncharacterized protein n=1 Tax=Corchorus olitorius TaxID=93759 RepID=A0A1R3H3X4_9ROSI|nr:hypothetical protein COLO4_31638 [Corchorus olitorius]